jgi:hypothetical protein
MLHAYTDLIVRVARVPVDDVMVAFIETPFENVMEAGVRLPAVAAGPDSGVEAHGPRRLAILEGVTRLDLLELDLDEAREAAGRFAVNPGDLANDFFFLSLCEGPRQGDALVKRHRDLLDHLSFGSEPSRLVRDHTLGRGALGRRPVGRPFPIAQNLIPRMLRELDHNRLPWNVKDIDADVDDFASERKPVATERSSDMRFLFARYSVGALGLALAK